MLLFSLINCLWTRVRLSKKVTKLDSSASRIQSLFKSPLGALHSSVGSTIVVIDPVTAPVLVPPEPLPVPLPLPPPPLCSLLQ